MSHQITLTQGESVEFKGGYIGRTWATDHPYFAELIDAETGKPGECSEPMNTFEDAAFWLATRLGILAIDGRAARLALYSSRRIDA